MERFPDNSIHLMITSPPYNVAKDLVKHKAASASSSTAWESWRSASNPTLRDVPEYILVFSKGEYKAESARRVGHPAPFPLELPHRLINLFSFETDLVLDPFMGSGTTGIAAIENNRNFVGLEINQEYIKLANSRIEPYRQELFSRGIDHAT